MEDKSKYNISKKGKALIVASLFVLALSSLGLYYFIFAPDWNWLNRFGSKAEVEPIEIVTEAATTTVDACPGCKTRWLDGVLVAPEKALAFPVAVVIDNDILARPQAGLGRASLVYEAPVEGGMTRYLAVFPADADLSAVGPVRSARPYFVTWASELKALFIHCGGSPEALTQIKGASLYDLNEFFNSNYFWRENSDTRSAPHNVLTSGDNWRSYLDNRGLVEKSADAWLFKTEAEHASSSQDISIRFSNNFKALWRYDGSTNEYLRFFNGTESRDEADKITAKNIIVHHLDSRVLDDTGRLRLDMTGTGEALICIDGVCLTGTWKKTGEERTRYYYENGEEIKLNPGITWIEVADDKTTVDY